MLSEQVQGNRGNLLRTQIKGNRGELVKRATPGASPKTTLTSKDRRNFDPEAKPCPWLSSVAPAAPVAGFAFWVKSRGVLHGFTPNTSCKQPVVPLYPFFGEGSPSKIDYREKAYSDLSTGGPSQHGNILVDVPRAGSLVVRRSLRRESLRLLSLIGGACGRPPIYVP